MLSTLKFLLVIIFLFAAMAAGAIATVSVLEEESALVGQQVALALFVMGIIFVMCFPILRRTAKDWWEENWDRCPICGQPVLRKNQHWQEKLGSAEDPSHWNCGKK